MRPIKLEGVSKAFDGEEAIRNVDLEIEPNEFHCIAGPNGSGKTTLFKLILGLYRPTEGNISRPEAEFGCAYQEPKFYSRLSVAENLSVFSKVGEGGNRWLGRLKEGLGLGDILDKKCSELSAGDSERVDLALSLLKRPDFLLFDEPVSSLDEPSRSQFLDFLREEDSIDGAVIFSHHFGPFEDLIERLTIICEGEIVEDEYVGELNLDDYRSLTSYYESCVEGYFG